MNLFNVFFHPRTEVKNALEKPNILVAVVLVVIYSVLSFATKPLLGITFSVNEFAIAIAKTFVGFLLMGGIIYVIAVVLKGKEVKVGFSNIASALSLIYVFFIIGAILSLISSALFLSQGMGVVADIAKKETLSFDETIKLVSIIQAKDEVALETFASEKAFTVDERNQLNSLILSNTQLFNESNFFISLGISLLGLFISVIGFLLVFAFLLSELLKMGFLKNAVVFIVLLLIFSFIGNNIFVLW